MGEAASDFCCGRSNVGVTEHHDQTTSGLTSEREEGALQDDVEKPLKKKRRRRSEASEQT